MVCVCECVLFFRIKPEDNNNKKLSFCILAKFAVVVVDLDVDFDSHSTAKVSNFAFSAQYNKRSNSNNNNNVVDSVVQQFAQNIVSISDSGQRQLKKFRALLGAIINELPARLPSATLTQSVSLSVYLSLSLSQSVSLCSFRQFWAIAFTHCRWAQDAVANRTGATAGDGVVDGNVIALPD